MQSIAARRIPVCRPRLSEFRNWLASVTGVARLSAPRAPLRFFVLIWYSSASGDVARARARVSSLSSGVIYLVYGRWQVVARFDRLLLRFADN